MCVNCFTAVDALAWSIGASGAVAVGGWHRLRDRLGGSRLSRGQRAWDANARFLSGLGHDPTAVLGPRPMLERLGSKDG